MIVAIDGPAGAGKSSVARAVAAQLGFAHLDTGAMYRAVTLAVLDDGVDVDDPAQLLDTVRAIDMSLDRPNVKLAGRDVTARLRSPEVTVAVSAVAAHPSVRAALVPLQKELAGRNDVVVEGRDIGTVVFPGADLKVYLTASPAERARRRMAQLGLPPDDGSLENEMRARDIADASRRLSPLQQAAGAHRIDSTGMSLDAVVTAIVDLVSRHRARGSR